MSNVKYFDLSDFNKSISLSINKDRYYYQVVEAVISETDAQLTGPETVFSIRYKLSKRKDESDWRCPL